MKFVQTQPYIETWYTLEDNQIVSFQGTLVDATDRPYKCFLIREQAMEYLAAIQFLGWETIRSRVLGKN